MRLIGALIFWTTLPLAILASFKVFWIIAALIELRFIWTHDVLAMSIMGGVMAAALISKLCWDNVRF